MSMADPFNTFDALVTLHCFGCHFHELVPLDKRPELGAVGLMGMAGLVPGSVNWQQMQAIQQSQMQQQQKINQATAIYPPLGGFLGF
jgi:hypothetical protein